MRHLTVVYLLGIFMVILPLLYERYNGVYYFVPFFLTLFVSITLFIWLGLHKRIYRLMWNGVDILFTALILWGGFSRTFVNPSPINPLLYWNWATLLLIYAIVRAQSVTGRYILMYAWVAGGWLQSIIGILQILEITPSNHGLFPLTGSFFNPGPYGGYMALSAVIGGGLFLQAIKQQKFKNAILWGIILLPIGWMLFLSDSRAAWLAALSGFSFLLLKKSGIRHFKLTSVIAICLIGLLAGGLYFYKKGSADARLLIWRASWELFTERPLIGHGVATFATRYPDAQREYLRTHSNSPLAAYADSNHQAFNEPIRLTCEQGLIGLFGMLSIGWLVFRRSRDSMRQSITKAGLVTFAVFSCFSYPMEIFPLKVGLVILLAMIHLRPVKILYISFKLKKIILCALCCITIGAIFSGIKYWHTATKLDQMIMRPGNAPSMELKENPLVIADPEFAWKYVMYLYTNNQHNECAEIFPKYLTHIKTPETLCCLGNTYINIKRYTDAENCFIEASQIVPRRIIPQYCLFVLYCRMKDQTRATRTAKTLLSFPVKNVNSKVIHIRGEARKFLNGDNTSSTNIETTH